MVLVVVVMSRVACPKCGNLLIPPTGLEQADILLIGEYPSYDHIRSGRLLGDAKVDEILRKELSRVGIQLSACRYINVWQHGKNKECDPQWHIDHILPEISGHKLVILMGAEATRAFVGKGIMEVAGLFVKSKLFPKVKFFAIPNAATLLRGDIGEMRLALEKLQKKLRSIIK